MYDPSIGVWLNRDPIGYKAGDENLYRYVENNPEGLTDPHGLIPPDSVMDRRLGIGIDKARSISALGNTRDFIWGTLAGQNAMVNARFVTEIDGEKFYYTLNPAKELNPVKSNTSTFFIFKGTPSKNSQFRLDFHSLEKGKDPVWHTNVGGKFKELTQLDHATSPKITATGRTITIFKRAGKPLFVLGVAVDAVDIYYAEDRKREVTKKVGGLIGGCLGAKGGAWAGAVTGGVIAGAGGQCGPQIAAPEEIVTVPASGMVGAIIGGIGGGIIGAWKGEEVTEYVWDHLLYPLEKEEWQVYECEETTQSPE